MAENKPRWTDAHASGILRVSETTSATRLASAITETAKRKNRFAIRAAGVVSVNTTCKALIIAEGAMAQRGRALLYNMTFDTVQGQDGTELTVLVFTVTVVARDAMYALYASVT